MGVLQMIETQTQKTSIHLENGTTFSLYFRSSSICELY